MNGQPSLQLVVLILCALARGSASPADYIRESIQVSTSRARLRVSCLVDKTGDEAQEGERVTIVDKQVELELHSAGVQTGTPGTCLFCIPHQGYVREYYQCCRLSAVKNCGLSSEPVTSVLAGSFV